MLPSGGMVLLVVFTTILVLAISACTSKPSHLLIALMLAVPAVAFDWVETFGFGFGLPYPELAFGAAFLVYTAAVIIGRILRSEAVSFDTISGAIAAYLLLGIAWSLMYSLVQAVDPSAIQLPETTMLASSVGAEDAAHMHGGAFLYFSFVTLTTLGYGDILPVSAAARSLASLEAVLGQIYLTVLVAHLVGMNISQENKN